MTKREFLDIVFALAPTEANAIMDAFDEYVDSNEPHWIPVTERLPEINEDILLSYFDEVTLGWLCGDGSWMIFDGQECVGADEVSAWMPLPKVFKEVTE